MNIVNQGLIESTSGMTIYVVDFTNSLLTNSSTLRASNGSTLSLEAIGTGLVTNTGGVIEALDTSIVRLVGGVTVEGGTVTSSGTGAIRGGGTLSNVTNTGTVAIPNNEILGLAGTLTNNALIRLDGAGSGPTLRIANNTTLTGSGVITLSDNSSNNIEGVNTGNVLTIAASAKIQGSGTINPGPAGGSRMANIINQGTIEANNVANGLSIRMENFNNTALTNSGTLRATNGATFTLTGTSTVHNSGGIIEALNGSNVRVDGGITVEGGTVTSSGTGAIRGSAGGGGGGTLFNVTNTGTVAIAPGEVVGLAGTLTNNGLVRLDSTGSASNLLLRSNVTIAGTGQITMGNNFNNAIAGDGTLGYVLTIAPGATIQGGGHFGTSNNNFNPRTVQIVNQGLIESTSGMTIYVSSSANSDVTNSGTFRASPGATLAFQGAVTGAVTNNGGVLEALAGGQVSLSSVTLTNYNSPTQTLTGGAYLANAGTLSLNIGAVAINAATVVLSGATSIFTPINSIRQNDGTFVITNGRTFGATPPQTDSPAGVFPNTGTLILGPNNSSFSITGDYSQGSGSVLEIVLGADYPNPSFHHMNVTGSASLAGTLEVKLANGYVPGPGQIEIIHAGAINGGFVTVNGATVTYTATGVFINATGNTNALQVTKAVSRKTHGPAGALDINLPLTGAPGVECRSSGGNHTLVFTFTNNLVSGNATRTSGVGTVSGSPTFAGKTMTVNLTGVADAQSVTVTLRGLTDVFSQVLPDQTVNMGVLLGDTTGSGTVNSTDVSQTKVQSGVVVSQANCRQDVTVSGGINSTDVSLVKLRSGSGIP